MKNQRKNEEKKLYDHLDDWVDIKEKNKETMKKGLLSFLNYVEGIESEKLSRRK